MYWWATVLLKQKFVSSICRSFFISKDVTLVEGASMIVEIGIDLSIPVWKDGKNGGQDDDALVDASGQDVIEYVMQDVNAEPEMPPIQFTDQVKTADVNVDHLTHYSNIR